MKAFRAKPGYYWKTILYYNRVEKIKYTNYNIRRI